MKNEVEKAHKKYRDGDHLTDKELMELISTHTKIQEGLRALNDRRYDLIDNQIFRDLENLKGFKAARDAGKKRVSIQNKMPSLQKLGIVLVNPGVKGYRFQSTSLHSYIFCDYKNIVALLGEPNSEGDSLKVDAEWEFNMNGKRMTIYNYKDGKNYNGENGLDVEDITEWHIGANKEVEIEAIELAKVLGGRYKKA